MYNRLKNVVFLTVVMAMAGQVAAQDITARLTSAFRAFEGDPQLKSALASLYVIDATTGKVVFDKNSGIGLAPASTQKVITSAAAYELLGREFRYQTRFGYYGALKEGRLHGGLYVTPSGDPTLGSWRWKSTSEDSVITRLVKAVDRSGIRTFGSLVMETTGWESEVIPGGWIWDDIGNYYGAGADIMNWRENQYDLILQSGKNIGDPVRVVGTKPKLYHYDFISYLTSAAKGTGDNAYIYFPLTSATGIVRGTIPVDEDRFTISGAMPSARNQFMATLTEALSKKGIQKELADTIINKFSKNKIAAGIQWIHTETSPSLDSISYWFLRRSINLYGEALAKTMAFQQGQTASASQGARVIRNFWKDKNIGVDASELNLHDGSGLSPLNRTTTHAQVAVLHYAQKQPWFDGYFAGFPEYNGMKLKSGTINGVKGFCGYHTSREGKRYIISFLVNNYNGSASSLVQKMYKVLDVLK